VSTYILYLIESIIVMNPNYILKLMIIYAVKEWGRGLASRGHGKFGLFISFITRGYV